MKRILFINPFGIGDVLFTTPLISSIKEEFPDSFIGYWCNQRVSSVLVDDPRINAVFALSRGDIKKIKGFSRITKGLDLFKRIKRERFDISLDFSLDHRYGGIAKLAGIKKRVGYDYKGRGRFLTDKLNLQGYQERHIVEYYLELLKFLGVKPQANRLYLHLSENAKAGSMNMLKKAGVTEGAPLIGIAPGGGESWGKDAFRKHWPADNFAELADILAKESGAKILILGDNSERAIADKIVNAAQGRSINLAGETSLQELSGVISRLNILICNDAGPLHMAVALGVKTVSIFGPVDPAVYGPYPPDENHIVLRKKMGCSPCYNKFKLSDCSGDRECLKGISVQDVKGAVDKLIN